MSSNATLGRAPRGEALIHSDRDSECDLRALHLGARIAEEFARPGLDQSDTPSASGIWAYSEVPGEDAVVRGEDPVAVGFARDR